jgi:hypothetical protein
VFDKIIAIRQHITDKVQWNSLKLAAASSMIENIPFETMAPRLLDSWSNPSCMSG